MKSFGFIFILAIFFTTAAIAQMRSEENLLDIHRREQKQTEENVIYKGIPFVKIEPTNDSIKTDLPSEKKIDFQKIQSAILPEYSITTPFGQKTTAVFIDHTTDFVIKIQIIDSETILVEEYIQLITTKEIPFKRILPITVPHIPQSKALSINVISIEKDKKQTSINIEESVDKLTIQDNTSLSPGVHNIRLKYIVKNALQPFNGATRLAISLTGSDWPLPIDRFTLITLQPEKTSIFAKELLFGSNNMSIINSFEAKTDASGNTFYTLNRPLPAFADVKIIEMFDGSKLLKPIIDEKLTTYLPLIIPVLSFMIVFFYLLSSAFYLKKKKPDNDILQKINSFPFFTLQYIQKKKLSTAFLQALKEYRIFQKKRIWGIECFIKLSKYRFFKIILQKTVSVFSFFFLSFKYLMTEIILIILTGYLATIKEVPISNNLFFILAVSVFFMHLIFFKFSLIPALQKEITLFSSRLLNPNIGFGLTASAIYTLYLRYYITTLSLDIQTKWASIIKESYPTVSLPFRKGE